jgi:hypothetical protein
MKITLSATASVIEENGIFYPCVTEAFGEEKMPRKKFLVPFKTKEQAQSYAVDLAKEAIEIGKMVINRKRLGWESNT